MTSRQHISLSSIYLISFLLALHLGLPLYINSSLLASVLGDQNVGLVFTAASLAILLALGYFRHMLERLGNFLTLQWVMVAELAALGTFLATENPIAITLAMTAHMIAATFIMFCMDIFLENTSVYRKTGVIRGKYLTAMSVGVLASPFIVGLLLTDSDYTKVYMLSIGILAVVFIMFTSMYRNFDDPKYEKEDFMAAWHAIKEHRNMLRICYTNFLLYLFYAIMVVYTPIYLSKYIGFSWSSIGEIFTIMLLPFILFQIPLGWLADKKLGEKEMLIAGFAITALMTGALTFISSTSALFWALALFGTRVGASIVEIMNETYFFKKTNDTNTPMLMFFRMTRPIGFMVGPTLASLTFIFLDFRYLFLVIAVIILTGIITTLSLKDTL
ncbi:MAG: Uncharacterized protein G01um101448_227 [Parcubacteria group bacterium Gr01-1014_48]|nr:MAG: Uncharacterized protein G01um101448_227 [Parcubacteria group bacterium Gr01-1014_48]TSD01380.1 MAG: Uncharacterized protein Greene101415_315 [Parcubacteria group bacterium Greene1014_15]TSD08299.1 MAG: Uncharacterized protein Greene07144_217 [Parcubacteria group bacterium Greene0714_4]